MAPVLRPGAVGRKITTIVQVAPTARGDEDMQLSVVVKSPSDSTRTPRISIAHVTWVTDYSGDVGNTVDPKRVLNRLEL